MMSDIRNPRILKLKGVLFLILGLFSAGLILAGNPAVSTALLLAVVAWSFARFYYFAFYVLERYLDPSFRYSGLGDMFRYLLWPRDQDSEQETRSDGER